MRLGILISCSRRDAKFLNDEIVKLTWKYDAKLIFAMLSQHEIRLVERVPEVIE